MCHYLNIFLRKYFILKIFLKSNYVFISYLIFLICQNNEINKEYV